jgi:hypothetical protein
MQCNKEELSNLLEMLSRVSMTGKEAFVWVGWIQKINQELQKIEQLENADKQETKDKKK